MRLLPATLSNEFVSILAHLSLVGVVAVAVRLAGWPIRKYLALRRPTPCDVALGVGSQIALSLAGAVAFAAGASSNGIAQTGPSLLEYGLSLGAVVPFCLSKVLVSPICEEIAWQGFLYRGLAASWVGPYYAIIGLSVVFMLLHFPEHALVGAWYLLSASLFGALRWLTGSLIAPIAAHVFGNGVAATFWTFGS
jgi:membrane protease YdiL (CAAX protease family)